MQNQDRSVPPHVLLFLGLISFLPLFGTDYGIGNQLEQFPIIERLKDPTFAAGDAFLDDAAQFGQPRYYYATLLAALSLLLPLHVVVHMLTVLSSLVLGLASFVAGRRLLGATIVGAAFAATLVTLNAGFSLGYAGFLIFESFQPASIAIPFVITGILLLLLGRMWIAAAVMLFSSLMHPTIGAEIGVIGYAATFLTVIAARRFDCIPAIVASGLIFLTGFTMAWVLPNIGGADFRLPDAEFFGILAEFRAPHHYLGLEMGKRRWLEALLFLSAIGVVLGYAWHLGVSRRVLVALALMVLIVVMLCGLSLYFVDVAHSRLWATAQVLRNLLLVKWVGFLLFGWLMGRWFETRHPALIVLTGLILLPGLDAISYAVILALSTWIILALLRLKGWPATVLTVPAILVTMYHMDRFGSADQTLRIAVALSVLWLVLRPARVVGAVAATAVLAGFLTIGYLYRQDGILGIAAFRSGLTWADRTDDGTEISRLARTIGPDNAVWMVPPNLEQFRYVAEKAIIVDFTSVPFSDAALKEWRDRITTLYGKTAGTGLEALKHIMERHRDAPNFDAAHELYGADYAVILQETPWDGPVLAETGAFRIVPIAPE